MELAAKDKKASVVDFQGILIICDLPVQCQDFAFLDLSFCSRVPGGGVAVEH